MAATREPRERRSRFARVKGVARQEDGYVLILVMLVLTAMSMMAATMLTQILSNQQHVSRDRAYTQSLAVAEAGLNQYLWMVASGKSAANANPVLSFQIAGYAATGSTDPHKATFQLTDIYDGSVKGSYTITVKPPSSTDVRPLITVTGQANSPNSTPRTVQAHVGRPAFSEYVLLVDDQVYIGGPLDRIWHGKTHSNTGIRIETSNVTDLISCAQATYNYSGSTQAGVWSQNVPSNDASKALWKFPVPAIPFGSVTADFARLTGLATGTANLPYANVSGATVHGYYIKLLPNKQWQYATVSAETENRATNTAGSPGNKVGGTLTYGTNSPSFNNGLLGTAMPYPVNGVIYANDNVWIEGTGLTGRITVASSGQLNPANQQAATSIHVIGDLTYTIQDGSVVVGLIAQNNVEIPMYAPYQKAGVLSTMDMEIDAAIIAQQGAEYVNRDASGQSNTWGPRRDTLTIFGSISTKGTPIRMTDSGGSDYAGFLYGANSYDSNLLHQPPPFFPTVGTYQILDWRELPRSVVSP